MVCVSSGREGTMTGAYWQKQMEKKQAQQTATGKIDFGCLLMKLQRQSGK